MTLTPQMFLIICPMLFLAGLVDAIGGGGGLISLPAYLLAGLPVHNAIATNKLSSTCGTALTTVRLSVRVWSIGALQFRRFFAPLPAALWVRISP